MLKLEDKSAVFAEQNRQQHSANGICNPSSLQPPHITITPQYGHLRISTDSAQENVTLNFVQDCVVVQALQHTFCFRHVPL
mmetsp:Transcript_41781/g.97575  ORF Transcript_41781/g.97575 Transcript_41781/m.97575 type:complete len:81 (-) Transcript_41781:260-502(-)